MTNETKQEAEQELIDIHELARRVGLCSRTLKKYEANGVLHPIVLSPRVIRYDPREAINALKQYAKDQQTNK